MVRFDFRVFIFVYFFMCFAAFSQENRWPTFDVALTQSFVEQATPVQNMEEEELREQANSYDWYRANPDSFDLNRLRRRLSDFGQSFSKLSTGERLMMWQEWASLESRERFNLYNWRRESRFI